MPHRPLSDFVPTEQIRQMADTTRRYCGPSALAFSPDARTLAYVSDRSGTYCAWTIPVAGHGFTKRKNQDAAYEKIVDFLTTELVG